MAHTRWPQSSVLSPTLLNLYISDMPNTTAKKIQFVDDDLALAYQARSFEVWKGPNCRLRYNGSLFRNWRSKPNPSKTEISAYHHNNREALRKLNITSENVPVEHNPYPKYLSVTLNRTLTFKIHLGNTTKKVNTRTGMIRKLAGSGWVANANKL